MLIRKERAGSTSLGHVWENDGDVVEVADEDVPALLAIRDAGFSVVEPGPEPTPDGDGAEWPDPPVDPPVDPVLEPAPAPEQEPVVEPAPVAENPVNEAPPAADPAAKTRTTRKPKAEA